MKKQKLSGSSLFIIGNILFGITGPLTKFIFEKIPLNFYLLPKFLIPGIIVWLVAKNLKQWKKLSKKQYLLVIGLAILNVTVSNLLFYAALEKMPALYSMLASLMGPATVYVLAIFLLKEKVHLKSLAGIMVSIFGILLLFLGSHKEHGVVAFSAVGLIFLIGSVLTSAYGTVLSKPMMRKIPAIQFVSLQLIIGSLVFVPQFLSASFKFNWHILPINQILVLVLLCILVTPLGYVTYFVGIKKIDVEDNAATLYIQPVAGVLCSVFLLGETMSDIYLASVATIMLGIWLGQAKISKIWIELQRPRELRISRFIKTLIGRLQEEL